MATSKRSKRAKATTKTSKARAARTKAAPSTRARATQARAQGGSKRRATADGRSPAAKKALVKGAARGKAAAPKAVAKKATAKKVVAKKTAPKAVAKTAAARRAAPRPARAVAAGTSRAPAASPRVSRRNHAGHIDPSYGADLRARAGGHEPEPRGFVEEPRSSDDLVEGLGEEFVKEATSAAHEGEDVLNQDVPEERGGPFVETTADQEFAHGTDPSNPKGAKREPFPTT